MKLRNSVGKLRIPENSEKRKFVENLKLKFGKFLENLKIENKRGNLEKFWKISKKNPKIE